MPNYLLSSIGFMVSFALFREYSSCEGGAGRDKKYVSYAVLRDSVLPSLKTGDMHFIQRTTKQYVEQVKIEFSRLY